MGAVSALGLGLALWSPAPASAAPAFVDAQTVLDRSTVTQVVGSPGVTCSSTSTTTPSQPTPVLENGGSTSLTATKTLSWTTGDPADQGSAIMTSTGSAMVSSAGGVPRSIEVSVSGQGQIASAATTSGCRTSVGVGVGLEFQFVLPVPATLDLRLDVSGTAYTNLQLRALDNPVRTLRQESDGENVSDSMRVFLPAGSYEGYFSGLPTVRGRSTVSTTSTVRVLGTFIPAGAQTAAAAGKAKKYVTLAGSATCASGGLSAGITSKKSRIERIRSVTFFLNDAKVTTLKHPKKGQVVTVPVAAPGQDSTLRAEVTLEPKGKGKGKGKGKKVKPISVSATYGPCS